MLFQLFFLELLLVCQRIQDLIYFHHKKYFGIYPLLHQTFSILPDLVLTDLQLLQVHPRLKQELEVH